MENQSNLSSKMHAIACANDRINRNRNPSRKETEICQRKTVMTGECAMGETISVRQIVASFTEAKSGPQRKLVVSDWRE
jgi:hypothetical protein